MNADQLHLEVGLDSQTGWRAFQASRERFARVSGRSPGSATDEGSVGSPEEAPPRADEPGARS